MNTVLIAAHTFPHTHLFISFLSCLSFEEYALQLGSDPFFSTTSHFHQYFFPSGKEFLENTKILGIVNEKNLFGPKVGSH